MVKDADEVEDQVIVVIDSDEGEDWVVTVMDSDEGEDREAAATDSDEGENPFGASKRNLAKENLRRTFPVVKGLFHPWMVCEV